MMPGKLVRAVPVLLTKDMKNSIELLISCREKLNITVQNKLLFARVFTDKPFDGSKIIREFKSLCNLSKPEFLTATALRHHLAVKTSIVGNEAFTEHVCQHMGHTKDVHKKNYRFPIQAIMRGKVGNQLIKLSGNEGNKPDSYLFTNDDIQQNNQFASTSAESQPQDLTTPTFDLFQKNNQHQQTDKDMDFIPDCSSSDDSDESVTKSQPRTRVKWTYEQKVLVVTNFANYIRSKKKT